MFVGFHHQRVPVPVAAGDAEVRADRAAREGTAVERDHPRFVDHLVPQHDVVGRLQNLVRVAVDDWEHPQTAEDDAAVRPGPVRRHVPGTGVTERVRPVGSRLAHDFERGLEVATGRLGRRPGNARGNLTLGRIDHEPRALVLGGQIVEPVNGHDARRRVERPRLSSRDGVGELRRRDVVHRPARPFVRALERRVRLVFSGEHPRDVRISPRRLRRRPVLLDAPGDEGLDRVRSGKAAGSWSGRRSLSPEHGGRHRDQADRGDERSTNSSQRGVEHPDLQESRFRARTW